MTNTSLLAGALGLLSAATLYAENAVIIEDLGGNIDSGTKGDWGGSRVPDGVALSQYAKTGDDDINVTHGKKSLQVDVSQSEGWVLDFKLTFSDEASDKLRAAVQSTDVARYILRYDIVFPGGTAWMNNEVFFGNINDQLDSQNA